MLALTNLPTESLSDCQLTFRHRQSINYSVAREQHALYVEVLRSAGLEVRVLELNRQNPDACFVEDVAIVLDEVAVMGRLGSPAREAESQAWRSVLEEFRPIYELSSSATLDGGDVLLFGKNLIVGRSQRTNGKAIEDLQHLCNQLDYRLCAVKVFGALHLKTACTALDDSTLLVNPDWIECRELPSSNRIQALDPWGANILRLPSQLVVNASCTAVLEQLRALGFNCKPVEIGEFEKAEAGLTCLSLIIG